MKNGGGGFVLGKPDYYLETMDDDDDDCQIYFLPRHLDYHLYVYFLYKINIMPSSLDE